jgi:hypothetical protein
MAGEILNCDGTDEIRQIDWDNIVGDKTLDNGGYFGDLLELSRVHLEESKKKGEIREEDAGEAYSTAIIESMKNAISFELGGNKGQLEVCYLQAQVDKLKAETKELIMSRKRALLELRLSVFKDLYRNKDLDNIPTIVDGTNASTIDLLYDEVHNGDTTQV